MPADTDAVYFPSKRPEGTHLVGVYYLADTDQPAPFALLLHGIPGSEKNHDLAQALRAEGWHALVLHFSGTWGSGGAYHIPTHPDDALAALDFALHTHPRPINTEKIAVVGFSLGSRAAIMSAAADSRIGAVVSIAGFCDFSDVMFSADFYGAILPLLNGVTIQDVMAQIAEIGEGVQPLDAVAQIAPRPVLIVHGTEDEVVPFYNADCFSTPKSEHITQVSIFGANHTFAAHRHDLIDAVQGFLQYWLG